MPAQRATASTTFYGKGDTGPWRAWRITDDYNEWRDLTDHTVYITIAHRSYSYWLSPKKKIVDAALCVVDPDQTAEGNRGVVWWRPEPGDLDVVGPMMAQFLIVDDEGREESVAPDHYIPIQIRARVGGDT